MWYWFWVWFAFAMIFSLLGCYVLQAWKRFKQFRTADKREEDAISEDAAYAPKPKQLWTEGDTGDNCRFQT